MVGKIRPRKIIMPSELTGNRRAPRRSGPVICYGIEHIEPEYLARLFPQTYGNREVHTMEAIYEQENMQSAEAISTGAPTSTIPFSQLSMSRQRDLLLDLIRKGKNDEEIGDAFGLSRWQIRNLRYRLGIKKDKGGNVYLQEPTLQTGTGTPLGVTAGPDAESQAGISPAGLSLTIRGTHSAGELLKRLDALRGLLAGGAEEVQYSFRVDLLEMS